MFYLNTIVQLFLSVVQLENCLPHSSLLTGIQILVVFQNLKWNSNKITLHYSRFIMSMNLNQKYDFQKYSLQHVMLIFEKLSFYFIRSSIHYSSFSPTIMTTVQ